MQFKESAAKRTAARRQGHAARVAKQWSGHVPPVQLWRERRKRMYEVFTTDDKQKRDEMFQQLRNSDQPNERQVVKFSSARDVPPTKAGEVLTYRSTWSVAYPSDGYDAT